MTIKDFFKRVADFFKSWWKVIIAGVVLLLDLVAFGDVLSMAGRNALAGTMGIFGTFIAIVYCVHTIINLVNEAKGR